MSKLPGLGRSAVPGVNAGHEQTLEAVRGLLRQNLEDLRSRGVKFRVTGESEYPTLDLRSCEPITVRIVLTQLIELIEPPEPLDKEPG